MIATFIVTLATTVLVAGFVVTSIAPRKRWSRKQSRALHQSPLNRDSLSDLRDKERCEVDKLSDLPEDWWTSEEIFDSEKRAIFAQVRAEQHTGEDLS